MSDPVSWIKKYLNIKLLVLLIGNVFLTHYDNIFNWIVDYSRTECADIGGTNSGTCAEGFGICCTSKFSCACKKASKKCYSSSAKNQNIFEQ